MRTEIPELKRCCFCLPLRRSLIAWGYLKLILVLLLLVPYSISLVQMIYFMVKYNTIYRFDVIVSVVLEIIWVVDVILNIIFIYGAHKKNVRLLKAYYFYSLTLLVIMCILFFMYAYSLIKRRWRYKGAFLIVFTISDLTFILGFILMQAYIILLLRSEINKLNNVGSFRFINNAAEAECSLNVKGLYEEKVVSTDNNNDDIGIKDNNEIAKCNGVIDIV